MSMPQKRGRRILESNDAAVNRRRQLAAARTRKFRERRRRGYDTAPQPIAGRLQKGERVVELGFTDLDAAETLAQIGLCTKKLRLAQSPVDARLKQTAISINERTALYRGSSSAVTTTLCSQPPPSIQSIPTNFGHPVVNRYSSGHPHLSRFFSSHCQSCPSASDSCPIPTVHLVSPQLPSTTRTFSRISSSVSQGTQTICDSEDLTYVDSHLHHNPIRSSDNEVGDDGDIEIPESDLELGGEAEEARPRPGWGESRPRDFDEAGLIHQSSSSKQGGYDTQQDFYHLLKPELPLCTSKEKDDNENESEKANLDIRYSLDSIYRFFHTTIGWLNPGRT